MSVELIVWSIGCVAALANAWIMDRRDQRDRQRAVDDLKGRIDAMQGDIDSLRNLASELARRVDRL